MPNFNYDAEQQDLERRQKIADAMLAGSLAPLGPTEMVGGYAVKKSPLEAIAKLVQGFSAGQSSRAVKDDRTAFAQRSADELRAGMESYDRTSKGYSLPGDAPLPPDVAGPVRQPETVAGDPRKAIFEAMSSSHPFVQKFGMSQFADQGKGSVTAKDLLPYGNPANIMANPNDPSKWGSKSNLGEVDGMVYDKDNRAVVQLGGPKPGFESNNGDLYQISPSTGAKKKLDSAPKIEINTGNKVGERFATKIAEQKADLLSKSYENAKGLPQTLTTLDEASSALAGGMKSGQLANVSLAIAKIGKSLGLGEVSPEIANTETFRSSMAQSVLEVLKTLRPASDKDVEYAEKAAGGNITLDDKTMLRLIDSARAATASKLYDHNQLLELNKRSSGAIAEDLDTFNIPFSVSGDNMEFRSGRFVATTPKVENSKAPKGAPKAGQTIKWGDL